MIMLMVKIIKSAITDNIFMGILDGPEDLFISKEFMISNISSLET